MMRRVQREGDKEDDAEEELINGWEKKAEERIS
jgi:hypothetical protein